MMTAITCLSTRRRRDVDVCS